MKRIGASMKTLVGFSKGDIEDPAQARAAAAAMNGLARQLPGWWRPGTAVGVGKSKAKPEIWQQRRQFNERIAAFRAAAAAMNRAAATGDKAKVGEQIKPLGGSCKGCHDLYQVKS
jgi:cytochrome c556